MKGHYSAALSSSPQITILTFVPKGIQNLLTIPNSRLLSSLSLFLLLLVLLAGSVFSQDPSELSANQLTLPDWAQFIINVLKCSNNPTVQASQTATKLIITILTDINACNNNISINNKRGGGLDHILSGGMISTDFLLFYCFWFFRQFFMFFVFLGYYTTFCLVLLISLSIFGHKPLRG